MKQVLVNYEQYFIEDTALLEIRHFHKELGLKYTTLVFLETNYLSNIFINKLNHIHAHPKTYFPIEFLKEKNYIEFTDLLDYYSESEINFLLIDLLKRSPDFYSVNFIFSLVSSRNTFTSEEVNWIINYSLANSKIRKSFIAQQQMLGFVDRNKALMENEVFTKVLKDFPHSAIGGQLNIN